MRSFLLNQIEDLHFTKTTIPSNIKIIESIQSDTFAKIVLTDTNLDEYGDSLNTYLKILKQKLTKQYMRKLDSNCALGVISICEFAIKTSSSIELKKTCLDLIRYFERFNYKSKNIVNRVTSDNRKKLLSYEFEDDNDELMIFINKKLFEIEVSSNDFIVDMLVNIAIPALDKVFEAENNIIEGLVSMVSKFNYKTSRVEIELFKKRLNEYISVDIKNINKMITQLHFTIVDTITEFNHILNIGFVNIYKLVEQSFNKGKYEARIDIFLSKISIKLANEINEVIGAGRKVCEEFRENSLLLINSKLELIEDIDTKVPSNIINAYDSGDEYSLEKIFDYKILNKVAENCGYKLQRQAGGHAQFINSDGKCVTIPQGRSIGKGLSLKIQKDLYS